MADQLLFEATFQSSLNQTFGYSHIVAPSPFALEIGAEYRVIFDGAEYPCTGLDGSPMGDGTVGIGNGAAFGLPGSGEPFCVGIINGVLGVACLLDTAPTQHSIAVYKVEKETGLVTENYDGSQVVHPGVESVSLHNTEGGIETFVHESQVAEPVEATVDVDWSGGDMVITPEAGQVFSRLLIPRPETAAPGNIREGVNLAGMVGVLAAGGGSIKFASGKIGTFTAYSGVEHGLGIVPDIVFAYMSGDAKLNGKALMYYGVSQNAVNLGLPKECAMIYMNSWQNYKKVRKAITFESATEADGAIWDVTSETFKLGSASYVDTSNPTIYWFAIGGLT